MSAITEAAKTGRWTIEGVSDLGSRSGCCMLCNTSIRYEYHLKSVDSGEMKLVGSTCGPTLVQASWSLAYWSEVQAKYERELGRKLTAEEIEKKKAEVSKAEWKRMADEYLRNHKQQQMESLKKLLARYVELKPWHNFARSILEQLTQRGRLTDKQREVASGMLAETDWDALERGQKSQRPAQTQPVKVEGEIGKRLSAVFGQRNALKPGAARLCESFMEQFTAKGSLSLKQTEILEEWEVVLGLRKEDAGKSGAPTVEQMILRLLKQNKLSQRQHEMLQSFSEQLKSRALSEKQVSIVTDIFQRNNPTEGYSLPSEDQALKEERRVNTQPARRGGFSTGREDRDGDFMDPNDL